MTVRRWNGRSVSTGFPRRASANAVIALCAVLLAGGSGMASAATPA
jgi:hypothetical protein